MDVSKSRKLRILLILMLSIRGNVCQKSVDTSREFVARNASIEQRLRKKIIEAHDHRFRPILNQVDKIDVTVEFDLLQILQVDELQMQIKISCAFHFQWFDEIRRWKSDGFGGIDTIHLDPNDAWRPRLYISNSVTDRDVFKDDYSHFSIGNRGKTLWLPGVILTTSCELNLRRYPYDTQQCDINIQSDSFSDEIKFHTPLEKAKIKSFTQNGEWELLNTSLSYFREGRFSVLKIGIYLERNPQFFVFNSILPTMMLSFLSLVVFLLPIDSGERSSFSMTVLLAVSLIQSNISAQLPKTPHTFPFIVMYLFSLLILSWFMVISNIVVLLWHYKQAKEEFEKSMGSSDLPSGVKVQGDVADQAFGREEYVRCSESALNAQINEHLGTEGGPKKRKVSIMHRNVDPNEENNILKDAEKISPKERRRYIKVKLCPKLFQAGKHSNVNILLFILFLLSWVSITFVFLLAMTIY